MKLYVTHMGNVLWLNMLHNLLNLLYSHSGWQSLLGLDYQLCLNTCFPTHLKVQNLQLKIRKYLLVTVSWFYNTSTLEVSY